MKTSCLLVLLALSGLSLGCRSGAARDEVPCTCGDPVADLEGCAHAQCLQGKLNPDNPSCVCGTLSIPK